MSAVAKTLTIKLPRPHPGQAQIVREAKRFNVVACGRRFGKSTMAVDCLSKPALNGLPVAYFAPTYKMLTEVWRSAKSTLHPVIARVSAQEHRLELITGGVIEFWSLDNPDAPRGRKYKSAFIDEAAMIASLEEAWQAVIRPTLADYQGNAWFASTPKGLNFFYHLFLRGQDQTQPDWQSWQMPTSTNPVIATAEIEAAKRDLPERVFAQEYLAQFLSGDGAVFRRVIEAATAEKGADPIDGHQYVIGCDWGRSNDFTVFTVMDVTSKRMVVLDRSNQIEYALQRGRLNALAEKWKPAQVIAEVNAMGQPIIEQIMRDGLPVVPFLTTNATKAAAIDALALAFERGEIGVFNDPILIGELTAYEAERLPSGLMRYGAPMGQHDDCVMSLALAWQGCVTRREWRVA